MEDGRASFLIPTKVGMAATARHKDIRSAMVKAGDPHNTRDNMKIGEPDKVTTGRAIRRRTISQDKSLCAADCIVPKHVRKEVSARIHPAAMNAANGATTRKRTGAPWVAT